MDIILSGALHKVRVREILFSGELQGQMIKSMAFKDEKRACHRFNICVGYCLPLISTGALFFKKIPFLTDMTLRLDGWVSL